MRFSFAFCFSILVTYAISASAQMGMGPQMNQGPKDEKEMVIKKGDDQNKNATELTEKDDYLNKPPSTQLFSLGGYMRLRSDYFYRLDLGLRNNDGGSSPFPNPLLAYDSDCTSANPPKHCRYHTITSTNMRLRLNPVIRPNTTISIHSSIDIFDNYVLGSSPYGQTYAYGNSPWSPYNGYTGTQAPVEGGVTSTWDVIRFKTLYGKVNMKLFDLKFGRVPNHFGLGMVHNAGNGIDDDYGDSVDRVSIESEIPSLKLAFGASWDFASQGYTSQLLYPWQTMGQPMDVDDFDDASQWTFFVTRKHSKSDRKLRLSEGLGVFDIGVHLTIRRQLYSIGNIYSDEYSNVLYTSNDPTTLADSLKNRKSFMAIPDLWLEYRKGKLLLQLEVAGKYGWITNLSDVTTENGTGMSKPGDDLTFMSLGGVFRATYQWSSDLTFKFELGYASGDDQYENVAKRGRTHFMFLSPFPANGSDSKNTLFMFHPNYHVGMIFYRELMGAVYNSTYTKFDMQYKVNNFRFTGMALLPMANEPVATPGNSVLYGAEMNLDLAYESQDKSILFGLSYGFFYPLDAMERTETIYGTYSANANSAHSIQARIVLRF
ncbi:TIGR04551 family protein [Myxococcota bacterium]|nr:TIGR04551 family protein [Myxococcota bacterium]MBU1382903.1 TIGR04551 family protein [Myxococcota bacterium]MBU1495391.1 TIGR04551 family protein [Myxococcota bacterium]